MHIPVKVGFLLPKQLFFSSTEMLTFQSFSISVLEPPEL